MRRVVLAAVLSLAASPSLAGSAQEGFEWLATTKDILPEGVLWNDRFGDGQDRYKTGGMTQSWVVPESVFSDTRWFSDQASGIEFNGRGLIISPENTAVANANDRAHAQYVGLGVYLRTAARPEQVAPVTTVSAEDRVGIEVGWQGEPLPLFDLQDALHDATGAQSRMNRANLLDDVLLVNFEAKRTWRFHIQMEDRDVQIAPYVQGSVGSREVSARAGADLIVGSSLEGRTWNQDPAIGALIPGGSAPRDGWHWMSWVGGDIGLIGYDAFIDGSSTIATTIEREPVTARLRAGVMLEYENFAVSYSLNWLSPEFDSQPDGQIVGALSFKYRF